MESPQSSEIVGVIGLGHMGNGVASRLLDAGYAVTVFNRTPSKAEALVRRGALRAQSLRDLAGRARVIVSFLPDDSAVREVYCGPDGVIANAADGARIIEMSTVLPDTARELYRAGAARGIPVLDAPVSGSTAAVEQGNLTVLAGGDADAFNASVPIFRQIARKWFHLGPSGSGAAMKLVVNTLLGDGMQAIAEAVTLGQKLGLQRGLLFDVLKEVPVVAPAHLGKLDQARRHDYHAQFPLRLMRKDFGLILDQAAKQGISMPLTAAAQQVFLLAAAGSDTDEDFSAVVRYMEQRASLAEPEFPSAA